MVSIDPIQGRFVAELLAQSAAPIADQAACLMLARHPDLTSRYAADTLPLWRDALRARVLDLSAALASCSPAMFAEQIAWSGAATVAREAPVDDLRQSLLALNDVLDHELPEEDRPLVALFINAGMRALDTTPSRQCSLNVDTPEGRLAANYLIALLEGDRKRAAGMVLDAVRQGRLAPNLAYTTVLIPALCEVGRLWHINELSIAEEHFATNTTRHVMSQLATLMHARPSKDCCAVVCAVQGNTHDIGARVVADFLEADGWRVIDMGADVPVDEIVASVDIFRADLVALSAMLRAHIRPAELAIQAIRERCPDLPVIVGGSAFQGPEALWRDIHASGSATTADAAVNLANALV